MVSRGISARSLKNDDSILQVKKAVINSTANSDDGQMIIKIPPKPVRGAFSEAGGDGSSPMKLNQVFNTHMDTERSGQRFEYNQPTPT